MSPTMKTPFNKHLLLAYKGWFEENGQPFWIVANSKKMDDEFLKDFADKNGALRLDLTKDKVWDLNFDNEYVSFKSKFNGLEHQCFIKLRAVIGVLEAGQLIPLPPFFEAHLPEPEKGKDPTPLRVVK